MRAFIVKSDKVVLNLGEIYVPELGNGEPRRAPIREPMPPKPPGNDVALIRDIQQVTFVGVTVNGIPCAAFENVEDFRHAIAYYGGYEQRDFFGDDK